MTTIRAVILAAGKGTRMPSAQPKALQTLLGEAMISHVYHALEGIQSHVSNHVSHEISPDSLEQAHLDGHANSNNIFLQDIWTVVGHRAKEVTSHMQKKHGELASQRCVLQEQQLGTGHALLCVLDKFSPAPESQNTTKILVVNADTPLLTADILVDFIQKSQNIPLAFMSLMLDEPASYGRVLRKDFTKNLRAQQLLNKTKNKRTPQNLEDRYTPVHLKTLQDLNKGTVERIVEAKDFKKEFNQTQAPSLQAFPEIFEVNAGIYLFDLDLLEILLPKISTANASGEYYLTDMVSLAHEHGYVVEAISTSGELCSALLGVNSPIELANAEKIKHAQEIERRLQDGVVIHAPDMVCISPSAIIEPGVEIFGPCEIYGKSTISQNTRIESHCYIENTQIASNCLVRPFCHFVDAHVGEGTSLGPYARLRPKARLAENVHVGNFVEIKKSTIAKGSKINHLSYIGDSIVGAGVNVGAGCITCNYDGVHKHQTTIHDNAFLGSNCAFVAPVTIGANSLIAAGSVITKDVPENSLGIARSRQQAPIKKKHH